MISGVWRVPISHDISLIPNTFGVEDYNLISGTGVYSVPLSLNDIPMDQPIDDVLADNGYIVDEYDNIDVLTGSMTDALENVFGDSFVEDLTGAIADSMTDYPCDWCSNLFFFGIPNLFYQI